MEVLNESHSESNNFVLGVCSAIIYCIMMFNPRNNIPTISYSKTLIRHPEIQLKNSSLIICGRHIHHWIMFSIAAVCMWFCKVKNLFYYGFAAVMTAQGLSYSDRFVI